MYKIELRRLAMAGHPEGEYFKSAGNKNIETGN